MPNTARPRVFCIGLPHSGGRTIADVFEANGYAWAHHKNGTLAQDIAFAQATGTTPLAGWPDVVGFSDLHSTQKRHLPPLSVGDFLSFLLAEFPDAYFIHTHREPADWIATRFWANNGEHRQSAAWHAGVEERDLSALWGVELARHRATCEAVFAGHARFLNINITTQHIELLRNFMQDDFDLSTLPKPVPAPAYPAMMDHLNDLPIPTPQPVADITFAAQVFDFCMEKADHTGQPKNLSPTAITWTAINHITDRVGADVAMARDDDGPFLLHPDAGAFERAQGTLNALHTHGARPPLQVDMMDARFLGSAGRRHAPPKTVAYNRRANASNLTLWPLPGYHTLAPRDHVGGFPSDKIPFEQKEDRCVWLGNLTGRMSPALTPEDRPQRGVYNIRAQIQNLPTSGPDWTEIISDLMCVPRYRVVKSLREHPDFEVGLVLRGAWKKLAKTRAFTGLCVPKQPRAWFHTFRYILSLAGNDTGSNFLSAASSNALILKEEDGWELFYTDAFKPWIHYVPLEEGATDIEEKLAWARANPDKSKAMSAAATRLYDTFANPNNRDAILDRIAARLNDMSN